MKPIVGNTLLEENHVYKMKLCTPKYCKEAFNDLSYYNTSKGMFHGDDLLYVIQDVLVVPSKRRNYVEEIITGIQIPLILVEVEKEYLPVSYSCSILGDAKEMVFACTVTKQKDIEKMGDQKFLLEEASNAEIIHYEKAHQEKTEWQEFLTTTIASGKRAQRQLLEEYKENLKAKRKEQVLKFFKWAKL